jgi:hypothetical protein
VSPLQVTAAIAVPGLFCDASLGVRVCAPRSSVAMGDMERQRSGSSPRENRAGNKARSPSRRGETELGAGEGGHGTHVLALLDEVIGYLFLPKGQDPKLQHCELTDADARMLREWGVKW